jgi:zinc/manganese transport system substrate-binding protein
MRIVTATLACALFILVSCGDDGEGASAGGDCPGEKVPIVVTVDQWADIVSDLAGDCGEVTTIIKGTSADPHDYEPTPADAAKFNDAKLVVLNGLDYDHWAEDAIEALDSEPVVINGGEVVGLEEGVNPHIWYGPEYVYAVADAVTEALRQLSSDSDAYFVQSREAWRKSMEEYDSEIAALKAKAAGKSFGATESVFDYMADAVGLTNATPQGYQDAAANEADPSPGDIAAFESALQGKQITVLIYNSQTEGAVPRQLREVADKAKVPIVEVTETVKPGAKGFADWQVGQLEQLSKVLS